MGIIRVEGGMRASILILLFPFLVLGSCVYLDMTIGEGNKRHMKKRGGSLLQIGPNAPEKEETTPVKK